ncbi:hypothetical protein BV20DRAFT_1111367 [Pilatotrama ljubarskyi]|nr:hypothetical protein BV20DRAFT_1111367 [Pilatotrama ljubarskyi]
MRLINTNTGEFHWVENPASVQYAILSHVWSPQGEQSFEDAMKIVEAFHAEAPPSGAASMDDFASGSLLFKLWTRAPRNAHPELLSRFSPKVRDFCAYARADGIEFGWLDTCCINKASSAELSEAINSMYSWYASASVCYAYLADVGGIEDPRAPGSQFRNSKWFTRGWTLQELIAPYLVLFLSRDWQPLGTKSSLVDTIAETAGIATSVLGARSQSALRRVSIAARFSWASKRVTTRVEDEAYSLMGLFGVTMPTIYGEGRHAFIRLQEEIIRRSPDQTIFAWGPSMVLTGTGSSMGSTFLKTDKAPSSSGAPMEGYLATSPKQFAWSSGIIAIKEPLRLPCGSLIEPSMPDYTITSHGLRTQLRILSPGAAPQSHVARSERVALLNCMDEDGRIIGLPLHRRDDYAGDRDAYSTGSMYALRSIGGHFDIHEYRTIRFEPSHLRPSSTLSSLTRMKDVHIVNREKPWEIDSEDPPPTSRVFRIILPPWNHRALEAAGYSAVCSVNRERWPWPGVSQRDPYSVGYPVHRLTITRNGSPFCIVADIGVLSVPRDSSYFGEGPSTLGLIIRTRALADWMPPSPCVHPEGGSSGDTGMEVDRPDLSEWPEEDGTLTGTLAPLPLSSTTPGPNGLRMVKIRFRSDLDNRVDIRVVACTTHGAASPDHCVCQVPMSDGAVPPRYIAGVEFRLDQREPEWDSSRVWNSGDPAHVHMLSIDHVWIHPGPGMNPGGEDSKMPSSLSDSVSIGPPAGEELHPPGATRDEPRSLTSDSAQKLSSIRRIIGGQTRKVLHRLGGAR